MVELQPHRRRATKLFLYRDSVVFYEKVVKVKADVAAILIYFLPRCINLWG